MVFNCNCVYKTPGSEDTIQSMKNKGWLWLLFTKRGGTLTEWIGKVHLAGRTCAVVTFPMSQFTALSALLLSYWPIVSGFFTLELGCYLEVEKAPMFPLPSTPQHLSLANSYLSLRSHLRYHFFQWVLPDLLQPLHSCTPWIVCSAPHYH